MANVQQDPRIALCVIDPDVPFRYLSLHGEVTAVTEEGAMDHIDALGRRYQNVENWSDRYDDVARVILEIEPGTYSPASRTASSGKSRPHTPSSARHRDNETTAKP